MDQSGNCKKFFINFFKKDSNTEQNNNMAHRYPLRSKGGTPVVEDIGENTSTESVHDDQSGSTVASVPIAELQPQNQNLQLNPDRVHILQEDANLD